METEMEILERLTNSNTCTEEDDARVQNLLRTLYFPNAVVIVGLVYLEGHGEPISIHTIAKIILGIMQRIKNM